METDADRRIKNMKTKIVAIMSIFLGILAAIGPKTVFPVCQSGMMKMKCYDMAQAELVVGLIAAGVGAGILFVKAKKVRLILSLAEIILGLLILLLPTVIIGVCGSPMMHCVSITKPALLVIGILEIVTGILLTVFALRDFKVFEKVKEI